MKWDEFLVTANRLIFGASESDWRSAASRAYYAVFHFFREWLRGEGLDVGSGAQAHNSLYVGFFNCGIPSVKTIGDRIDTLRGARTHADYDLRKLFLHPKAASYVHEAELVVKDFQSLLKSVPVPSFVFGVKRYLISIGRLPKKP